MCELAAVFQALEDHNVFNPLSMTGLNLLAALPIHFLISLSFHRHLIKLEILISYSTVSASNSTVNATF
jgi:hypothetical protein